MSETVIRNKYGTITIDDRSIKKRGKLGDSLSKISEKLREKGLSPADVIVTVISAIALLITVIAAISKITKLINECGSFFDRFSRGKN